MSQFGKSMSLGQCSKEKSPYHIHFSQILLYKNCHSLLFNFGAIAKKIAKPSLGGLDGLQFLVKHCKIDMENTNRAVTYQPAPADRSQLYYKLP